MEQLRVENKSWNAVSWISLFAGLGAGAAIGLLFAPRSGKESREKIAEWLKEKRAEGRTGLLDRKTRIGAAMHAAKEAFANQHAGVGV